jgi:predicted nucleotidyltransferase component of viral defense system
VRPIGPRPIVRGYDEYEDLPDDAEIRVYSLEEIAVEKVVALGDRARNEPRDLYDAWHLTSEGHVDIRQLKPEVESKLEFRSRTLATLGEEFVKKEARLKKLWSARLAAQMAVLPEFDGVFRAVQRSLRQADLL